MKTIEQFYEEAKYNKKLMKAFQEAIDNKTVEAFLKEQQIDASLCELEAFGKTKSRVLSDDELKHVEGGLMVNKDGEWYEFTGNYSDPKDYNKAYRCPICGRLVHWGSLSRWYCDPCNTSWFYVEDLKLNKDSGLWHKK